jgi:hypothetical protein
MEGLLTSPIAPLVAEHPAGARPNDGETGNHSDPGQTELHTWVPFGLRSGPAGQPY